MTATLTPADPIAEKYGPLPFPMSFEIVVIPVADVDRAKAFYARLGWRFDIDYRDDFGFRVIQYTPPASGCSLMFGDKMTTAAPGSAQGLHLVVSDIVRTHDELLRRGVEVSEVFHDRNGVFHHAAGQNRVSGPNAERKSYGSFLSFNDPDGNEWIVQEVTERLAGRVVDWKPPSGH